MLVRRTSRKLFQRRRNEKSLRTTGASESDRVCDYLIEVRLGEGSSHAGKT